MRENGFPRLKQLRLDMKLNQKDFANSIGLNLSTYNNYEVGVREPNADFWAAISKKYGVSIDYLLGLSNKKFSTPTKIGGEGNDSDEILVLSSNEQTNIKKYRALDEHGKEIVDTNLEIEYKRVQQAQEAAESDDDNIIDMMQFLTPVSAGTGEIIYSTSAVGNLSVASNSYTRKADFCVTVKGNSMEPRFCDGDIVLVQECEDIEYGDIGIFILGGQSYIKQKGEGKLISLNKNIPDVILGPYDEVICQGKVIGVLDPDWIVK